MTEPPDLPDWVDPSETEVERAIREDPEFGDVIGRIRARLRNVEYNPDLHHPHRKRQRDFEGEVGHEYDAKVEALAKLWDSRGTRQNKYLRSVPSADRPGLRKVRDL